jgi:hypothetical protein
MRDAAADKYILVLEKRKRGLAGDRRVSDDPFRSSHRACVVYLKEIEKR